MQQNTPEWLEFRRNKIGASDAPTILGISPYPNDTPYKLWEQKVFGKDKEETAAMAHGHSMEETALAEFEKVSGISMMPKIVVHPERTWQMASLDGVAFNGKTFVEIKCPKYNKTHEMAQKGEIPPHYEAQMQHQMSVLGVSEGFYFNFYEGKGILLIIRRDEKFIEDLIEKEEKFLTYMQEKKPPPLTDRDYVEQTSDKWIRKAEEWKNLHSQIKIMEEAQEEIRKDLMTMTCGQNSKGGGIRLTRSIYEGRVDYDNIPELIGVNLNPYRRAPIERWTLSACK